MKIYTRTGDKGQTSIYGGSRLSKDDIRIEAYGTVDELNSWIGMIRSNTNYGMDGLLHRIQENLFVIGSFLASTEDKHTSLPQMSSTLISDLENAIDNMQSDLDPLKTFILPTGNQDVVHCHLARTVCRRAERRVVSFSIAGTNVEEIIKVLNRLSDFLFVLSRFTAKMAGISDTPWNP